MKLKVHIIQSSFPALKRFARAAKVRLPIESQRYREYVSKVKGIENVFILLFISHSLYHHSISRLLLASNQRNIQGGHSTESRQWNRFVFSPTILGFVPTSKHWNRSSRIFCDNLNAADPITHSSSPHCSRSQSLRCAQYTFVNHLNSIRACPRHALYCPAVSPGVGKGSSPYDLKNKKLCKLYPDKTAHIYITGCWGIELFTSPFLPLHDWKTFRWYFFLRSL